MSIPATAVQITVTPSTGALAVTSGRLYAGAVNQLALVHATAFASWGDYGVLRLTIKPKKSWTPTLVKWTAVCDAIAAVGSEYMGGTLDLTATDIRTWCAAEPRSARCELWDETDDLVVAAGDVQLAPALTYDDDVADTAVPSRGLTDAQIVAYVQANGGGKPAGTKTVPVDADGFSLWDSEFGFQGKYLTWANIQTALGLLYSPIAHLTDAAAHSAQFAAKLATSTFTAHSAATSGTHGSTLTNARTPTAHAGTHTNGTDDIQTASAVGPVKGLMSGADALKLYGIEAAADVTDAANVSSAWRAAVAAAIAGGNSNDLIGLWSDTGGTEHMAKIAIDDLRNSILSYQTVYVIQVAALPTVSVSESLPYLLTAADSAALAPRGMYLRIGGTSEVPVWACIVSRATYAIPGFAESLSVALIPGVIYTMLVGIELSSWTLTRAMFGVTTIIKSGAFAVALPTLSGRTTKLASPGAWDDADAALARIVIEDDGTYLICSATALSATDSVSDYAAAVSAHAAIAAGVHGLLLHKLDATTAPGVGDDSADGYAVGSRWVDVTADVEYVCLDNAAGAAVWQATTGASGIGGATGSVDNAVLRANGTGGATAQASDIAIDDATASTQQNVAVRNVDAATNSALVLSPKGTGALIAGPKPDGVAAVGGNARGTGAVDLQLVRTAAAQVASGNRSFACNKENIASGAESFAAGASNSVSNTCSAVFGLANSMTGDYGFVTGRNNTITARGALTSGGYHSVTETDAVAIGGSFAAATLAAQLVHSGPAVFSPSVAGEAQHHWLILRNQLATTDATQLFLDGTSGTKRAILTAERTWFCAIKIVARQDNGKSGHAERRVCIQRTGTTTALVGTVQTVGTDEWDTELGTPTIAVTADDTNEALVITITQANSTSTRWVAVIDTVEVGY